MKTPRRVCGALRRDLLTTEGGLLKNDVYRDRNSCAVRRCISVAAHGDSASDMGALSIQAYRTEEEKSVEAGADRGAACDAGREPGACTGKQAAYGRELPIETKKFVINKKERERKEK